MSLLIDLSQPLQEVSFDADPKIKYFDHKKGANLLGLLSILDRSIIKVLRNIFLFLFGINRITHKSFPDKMGLAWERFSGDTHTGTHLDAPYHFGPTVSGVRAKTIDEIPLEWCFSDGVVLDFSNGPKQIGQAEVKEALSRLNYKLKPLDIVLIYTGASRFWNTKKYPEAHNSVTAEAIKWLASQGIKIIGIDAFTIDPPFKKMYEQYLTSKDSSSLWPGHFVGRQVEYCHIENLTNLEALIKKPFGFKVSCFPVKLYKGSAGWTRVVAIY